MRTKEIIDGTARPNATSYLNDLLNSDFENQIPYGFYYVDDTVISNSNKQINWNGSTLYTDLDIDLLKVRGDNYSHSNLELNKELVANPNVSKNHLTIQGKGENMMYYQFNNIRLIGSVSEVQSNKENIGNTGVLFDNLTDIGNGTKLRENHWGRFDLVECLGLRNVVELDKALWNLAHSRLDFFIQGTRCKQAISVKGVNSCNIFVKWNDSPTLLDSEIAIPLIYIESERNSIRREVADFPKTVQTKYGYNQHGHQYKVTNNARYNHLMNDGVLDGNYDNLIYPYII